MQLRMVKNGLEQSRIFVTLVRKYGSSVQRNRAKRVVREIYRHEKHQLRSGFDYAIILFPDVDTYMNRQEQLKKLWKQAGAYNAS
jgi:ribonuclease P protein component